jgi:ATP-dependent Clp protease ATP-binding subunit ClpA
MFERFTNDARSAVVGAQLEARTLGHRWVGTEHLLVAILADRDSAISAALRPLGLTDETVRAGVLDALGLAPVDDHEALRDLGIDLDAVRRRVEERFGPGALDRDPTAVPRGRLRRAMRRGPRHCSDGGRTSGHLPFTPRAKKGLELALREAVAQHSKEITAEHLVLGLMRTEGLAARVVTGLGTRPDAVRRAVLDLRRAA